MNLNITMGIFWVVIVSCVLLDIASALAVDPVTLLLSTSCPKTKGIGKILPEACNRDKVPSECEIMIDYILRLCKREDFSFEPNPNATWTCPLDLPAIEHETFKNNPDTQLAMVRLNSNATCLVECSGNSVKLCGTLHDLAMLIKKNATPLASNSQPVTKTEVKPPQPVEEKKPATQQESSPNDTPSVPKVGKADTPAPPVPEPVHHEDPAPVPKPEPVPEKSPVTVEDPEPEIGKAEPNVKAPDLDSELEPPNTEDYIADDEPETESKSNNNNNNNKPASNIGNEVVDGSTAMQSGPYQEAPDSHFFAYFLFFTSMSVIGYIAFHNKNKLLALALEGRRGRQGRRRPNSASYRMLDNSLEEAIMSNPSRVSNSPVIF